MDTEEQTIYEWQYGMMGDFKLALMETICRADVNNLNLLKLSFPNEVNGYIKFSRESEWWEAVQKKMGK